MVMLTALPMDFTWDATPWMMSFIGNVHPGRESHVGGELLLGQYTSMYINIRSLFAKLNIGIKWMGIVNATERCTLNNFTVLVGIQSVHMLLKRTTCVHVMPNSVYSRINSIQTTDPNMMATQA